MEDFKDLYNLQMFFDRMRAGERQVIIHPNHSHAGFGAHNKGTIIYAGEDYVAIQIRGDQRVIPYNAIWRVDMVQ